MSRAPHSLAIVPLNVQAPLFRGSTRLTSKCRQQSIERKKKSLKQRNKTGGSEEEAYGNVDLGSALKQCKFICLRQNLVRFQPNLCKAGFM